MRRVLLAKVFVVVAVSTASAAPTRKVRIETEPPGATVFLESKDTRPVCDSTPCTFDAPVGDTAIILELVGFRSEFQMLSVPARGKLQPFPFKLTAAIGTLVVDGPKGASITVGDIDRGKAPTSFEMPAGSYFVQLSLNGKPLDPIPVNVEEGQEVRVTGSNRPVASVEPGPSNDPEPEIKDDPETGGTAGGISAGTTTKSKRGPMFALSAVVDVGFRDFTYDNPQYANSMVEENLNDESERGQVIIGPYIEIWPATLLGLDALPGLAIVGRYGYGVNKQVVERKNNEQTGVKTFWQVAEAGARYRWTIANKGTVEVGGGWVRDQYQFEGDIDDLELVPDADYQAVRIGLRGSVILDPMFEPYLGVENRIVLSGGKLEQRFPLGHEVKGLRALLGFGFRLGPFAGRVEGSLTQYSWTFKNDGTKMYSADGGTDSIKYVSGFIGYAY